METHGQGLVALAVVAVAALEELAADKVQQVQLTRALAAELVKRVVVHPTQVEQVVAV